MHKQPAKDVIEFVILQPLFETLPLDVCDELCQQSLVANLEDKEVLIAENELNHSLYLIVEGSAQVIMNGTQVSGMQCGDIVGEISVAGISPPVASVIANGEMQVIIFPAEAIHTLMLTYDVFAKTIRNLGIERICRPS